MLRRIDYRLIITLLITAGLLLVSGFCFGEVYVRIGEAFKDLGLAIAGFVCFLFGIEPTFDTGSVNKLSSALDFNITVNAESIRQKFSAFGAALISEDNFFAYMNKLFSSIGIVFYVILIAAIIIPFLLLLLRHSFSGSNNNIGKESLPLRIYKKFEQAVYIRIKRLVLSYWQYVCENGIIKIVWLVIAIFSLNIVTIAIEALANYFYFLSSMTFYGFFVQLQKLIVDLSVFTRVPLVVWAMVAIVVLLKIRVRIALNRLYAREAKNGAFVKSLSSVGIISAVMGAGKTRFLTDMLLIKQKQYRVQALSTMIEIDCLFPNFPWRKLESKMRDLMDRRTIFNISSCEAYAKNWKIVIDNCLTSEIARKYYAKGLKNGRISEPFLLGYEWEQYGYKINNGLKIEYLSDVIVDYMKAFFIYTSPTSMIFSNYAISVIGKKLDNGNLPLWAWNFFGEVVEIDERQNSHISDMDMFRLGKRKKKDNDQANAFEYGVVGISEADKERGNQFDTQELKKNSDEANQKNDNFNGLCKMSRQITNIRGVGYFFMLLDMQRFASINLDMREIGDELNIANTSDEKMLMPFFALDELIYQLVVPFFESKYEDYSYRRGDMTLGMYLFKKVASSIRNYHKKMFNQYGCIEQEVVVNDDRSSTYYILPKKIHADVYSTDIMASFFRKKASFSKKGINDIPTFKSVRASFEELSQMNSYMVDSWFENLSELDKDGQAA